MKVRLSFTNFENWSFVFGMYRLGDTITLCFAFFSVSFPA